MKNNLYGSNIEMDSSTMCPMGYEHHSFKDPKFPVIFHTDYIMKNSHSVNPMFNTTFISHWHENIELLYIIDKSAYVRCGDEVNCIKKGETAVINSGVFHHVEPKEESVLYNCLIIDREFLKKYGINTDESVFYEKVSDEEIGGYMCLLADAFKNGGELYKVRCIALTLLIMEKLYSTWRKEGVSSTEDSKPAYTVCKKVLKYINENFSRKIDIGEMAEKLNISKYYMCHCFKECSGYSIVDFANVYRTERARRLIVAEKVSVSSAAESCGFTNMSYFTKVFKKNTGILPSELKKN